MSNIPSACYELASGSLEEETRAGGRHPEEHHQYDPAVGNEFLNRHILLSALMKMTASESMIRRIACVFFLVVGWPIRPTQYHITILS